MGHQRSMSCLTREDLTKRIKYNPETGHSTYLESAGCRVVGDVVGSSPGVGYVAISIGKRRALYHDMVWFYVTGDWPVVDVDHKDGDKRNNRWDNLRLATRSQNASNAGLRLDNELGVKGVRLLKDTGKYQVRVSGKSYGCYEDLELAELVCHEARLSVHGEFARNE